MFLIYCKKYIYSLICLQRINILMNNSMASCQSESALLFFYLPLWMQCICVSPVLLPSTSQND